MNRKTDNELLDDVLSEAAPADFREALLDQTLRVVRRRRRIRHARKVGAVFVALALLGAIVWEKNLRQPSIATAPSAPKTAEKGYTLIHTQPLSAAEVITTQPLATVPFITSTASVEIVQTTPGNFRTINDQQLLALVAAHPAVLVRTGPHSEQLVFANPQDAKGFPLN